MLGLLELLAASDKGKGRRAELCRTHPSPERRIERIQALISHLCQRYRQLTRGSDGGDPARGWLRREALAPEERCRLAASVTTPTTRRRLPQRADRVRLLREAFQAAMRDPAFRAEAERTRLEADPVSGEELARIVGGLFGLDSALAARLRTVLLD
jgi:hypothetical protein